MSLSKSVTESHAANAFSSSALAIGIDIGGTKINAGIVCPAADDSKSQIRQLIDNTPTPTDPRVFLETLCGLINTLAAADDVTAVGIATAGVVDSSSGRILGSTANMPALQEISDLAARLSQQVALPIHIENDANAAAYGEARCGAGRDAKNGHVMAVTLGTGVGMGLILGGKLYRGAHYWAGEGGHVPIHTGKQRRCTCGRWDCWEIYASGNGLRLTAELAVEAAEESIRRAFLGQYGEQGNATTYAVMAAVRDEHPLGMAILDAWHEHIAIGLAGQINVLDPDVTVIGGGLAQFVDFDRLAQLTLERTMNPSIRLASASLGNLAGLVGAACLAMEALG